MKKKLFSILLSLAMVITMMPAMTMTAYAGAYDLKVLNQDSSSATPSEDYEYSGTVLHIKDSGLVVTGTTQVEQIVVDSGVESLTLKNLNIVPTSTEIDAAIQVDSSNLVLTLEGTNKIGNEVTYDSATTTAEDYYVGTAIKGDASSTNLIITGSGSLEIYDGVQGICAKNYTSDENFSGNIEINDFGSNSSNGSIYATNDLKILEGTTTIISYNSNSVMAMNNLIIEDAYVDITNNSTGSHSGIGSMNTVKLGGCSNVLITASGVCAAQGLVGFSVSDDATLIITGTGNNTMGLYVAAGSTEISTIRNIDIKSNGVGINTPSLKINKKFGRAVVRSSSTPIIYSNSFDKPANLQMLGSTEYLTDYDTNVKSQLLTEQNSVTFSESTGEYKAFISTNPAKTVMLRNVRIPITKVDLSDYDFSAEFLVGKTPNQICSEINSTITSLECFQVQAAEPKASPPYPVVSSSEPLNGGQTLYLYASFKAPEGYCFEGESNYTGETIVSPNPAANFVVSLTKSVDENGYRQLLGNYRDFNDAIYFVWILELPEDTSRIVKFNMNGHGTQVLPIEVSAGGTVTAPTNPTAEGWEFGGWYKDKNCTSGNEYDFSSTVNYSLTLFAKWTEKQGPNPSGGDTPASDTTEEYTIPVEAEGSVQIETAITNGQAEVKEITKESLEKVAKSDGGQSTTDTIKIDLSNAKQEVKGVVLTKPTVENLADVTASKDNDITCVEIALTKASVTLDSKALNAINEQANGDTIQLVVDDTKSDNLNKAQQSALNDFEVSSTFEAYFESNGQRIHDFKGGVATVSMKFEPAKGKNANNYKVYYIEETGKMVKYATKYANGLLKFATTHFSDYAIVYDTSVDVLLLNGKASGSKAVKLSWNGIDNASKYVIYGAKCGNNFKKLKTLKGKSYTVKKIAGKSLSAHKAYKFYVIGYDAVGNKVKSKTIHFVTANTQGKYANVKSIKAKYDEMLLSVGISKKIGATYKMYSGKKHIKKAHGTALRYVSTNTGVAKVNSSGKVTAVGTGTATIYIQDIGGKYCKTKVTVN